MPAQSLLAMNEDKLANQEAYRLDRLQRNGAWAVEQGDVRDEVLARLQAEFLHGDTEDPVEIEQAFAGDIARPSSSMIR